MAQTSSRKAFDLPSGCPSVAVPRISVVSICSIPQITLPYSITIPPIPPVIPPPPVPPPPCIDIVPNISIFIKPKSSTDCSIPSETQAFKTADGSDDCVSGHYELNVVKILPCVLDGITTNVKGDGRFTGDKPSVGLRINKGTCTCAVESVSMYVNLPCVVSGFSSIEVVDQNNVALGKLNINVDHEICQVSVAPTFRLNLPSPCIQEFTAAVDIQPGGGSPSGKINIKKVNVMDETCVFNVSYILHLPSFNFCPRNFNTTMVITQPCSQAGVSLFKTMYEKPCSMKFSMLLKIPNPCIQNFNINGTVQTGDPRLVGLVTKSTCTCNFMVSLMLYLPGHALCPPIYETTMRMTQPCSQTHPSIHKTIRYLPSCTVLLSMELKMPNPCIQSFSAAGTVSRGDAPSLHVNIKKAKDECTCHFNLSIRLNLPDFAFCPPIYETTMRITQPCDQFEPSLHKTVKYLPSCTVLLSMELKLPNPCVQSFSAVGTIDRGDAPSLHVNVKKADEDCTCHFNLSVQLNLPDFMFCPPIYETTMQITQPCNQSDPSLHKTIKYLPSCTVLLSMELKLPNPCIQSFSAFGSIGEESKRVEPSIKVNIKKAEDDCTCHFNFSIGIALPPGALCVPHITSNVNITSPPKQEKAEVDEKWSATMCSYKLSMLIKLPNATPCIGARAVSVAPVTPVVSDSSDLSIPSVKIHRDRVSSCRLGFRVSVVVPWGATMTGTNGIVIRREKDGNKKKRKNVIGLRCPCVNDITGVTVSIGDYGRLWINVSRVEDDNGCVKMVLTPGLLGYGNSDVCYVQDIWYYNGAFRVIKSQIPFKNGMWDAPINGCEDPAYLAPDGDLIVSVAQCQK